MAKNITTVTHADESVSKRSSASAVYTHAVVVKTTRETLVARAEANAKRAEEAAAEYREAAAKGSVVHTVDTYRASGYSTTDVTLGGVFVAMFQTNTDGSAKYGSDISDADARAKVEAYAAGCDDTAKGYRASAAKHLAGPEAVYDVVRWSRRFDLAAKAAQGEFAHAGDEVTVVAVDAR